MGVQFLVVFQILSKENNKSLLLLKTQIYANKAYGRKFIGSVETEPTPELRSFILDLL